MVLNGTLPTYAEICQTQINNKTTLPDRNTSRRCSGFEQTAIWWLIKLRIFYCACVILKRPGLIWKIYKQLLILRNDVWGGDLKKIYKVDGRYYFNQYTSGWPSKAYDEMIKREIKRHADTMNPTENLSFIFLAITRKCPMRCEHCFEWENLNHKELFTREDLLRTVDVFQNKGVLQFHFSGGEPMARFKDLLPVVKFASMKSECWVVTSGFNFTNENARLLKAAGCRGVVVSIDHYIPDLHNLFRGSDNSFQSAVNAVAAAKQADLVTSISVCATKSFLEGEHLLPYMDFAKRLGVQFVQVLEPKDVGHYENKDILLAARHIDMLDTVFKLVNHSPVYRHYPTMLYHGYHQRRIGCFSGSRSVYIDSVGDVHACPFCHTKSYNIIELFRNGDKDIPVKENKCPRYKKIV